MLCFPIPYAEGVIGFYPVIENIRQNCAEDIKEKRKEKNLFSTSFPFGQPLGKAAIPIMIANLEFLAYFALDSTLGYTDRNESVV